MNLNIFRILTFLCIAFCFSSCAPGLGSSVDLRSVSKVPVELTAVFNEKDNVKLNVLSFSDARPIEAIVEIDGRLIKPDSDAGAAAQRIFETIAKNAGIKLTMFNSPSVRGAVREWKVTVEPGFPASKLEAVASVNLDLLDTSGNIVVSSVYTGNYEEKNPFMTDSKIEDSLGKSMAFAMAEAFKDGEFVRHLTAVANPSNEQNY